MPGEALDRDDLISGLNAVIAKLRAAGQPAGIRIIGGAALALRYFDRDTTTDIDARLQPEGPIRAIATDVARENQWPSDWLNSAAAQFIPTYGADPEWEVLYSSDGITVEVASPRALLAMKLNASRAGRDDQDIANLLAICKIPDIDAAEDLLNEYFPGDALPDKALRILVPVFAHGLPDIPAVPPTPVLGLDPELPSVERPIRADLTARKQRFPELRNMTLDPYGLGAAEDHNPTTKSDFLP
ncbi:DUF6036 family nucleotidyltransferase [Cryobacterium luteum]|uniref:Nucleotidyl transferase AbiEii toxin, Type IV TA system n=1 Tax=Cryobacterium luteum TaxID=1424661 RepID=A0A1H8L1U6_9MICO|nr:DUF6036 family nucleotidyltransferase [Cryobacterium luteum]TFB82339.1 hypothetical protein E3O10_17705 [Cryobacterium luteum]SEN98638.1 hypothetical protein SAMN05216281_1237 [Cryobacterium luteum]